MEAALYTTHSAFLGAGVDSILFGACVVLHIRVTFACALHRAGVFHLCWSKYIAVGVLFRKMVGSN